MSDSVHYIEISEADDGQRIDNFLRKRYPTLPKSRIYQMLRKGEVRLNKKRIKPVDRIHAGDYLRIPPIVQCARDKRFIIPSFWCESIAASVIVNNEDFLILNKPAGLAVHGGSAQPYGVIDVVQQLWGHNYAALAHRLDKDTSGVLVLGKHRQALVAFQQALQTGGVEKRYQALVVGSWDATCTEVSMYLEKGQVHGGERMVSRADSGQYSRTFFRVLHQFSQTTCLEVTLDTGRTHQIRVVTAAQGHPIVGDDKYGDKKINQQMRRLGARGMFLHAQEIRFCYNDRKVHVNAPLPTYHAEFLASGNI